MTERQRATFEHTNGRWLLIALDGEVLIDSPSAGAVSRYCRENNIDIIDKNKEAVDPNPAG